MSNGLQSITPTTLIRTVGPSQNPVSLEQAKQTLRLSPNDTTHDADISRQIEAATEQVEQDTDRALITQTFQLLANEFPAGSIPFANKPIQSVTSITYIDTDGATQTVDDTTYALDQGRRQVYLLNSQSWPQAIQQQNAVTVEYVAGYGDTSSEIPRMLQQAVLMQVGRWFFDPAMETGDTKWSNAYGVLIDRILRTSYP